MTTIRVLSAEGEETTWLRAAALEQATALKDWIDSAADDGGAFATPVPAKALRAPAAFPAPARPPLALPAVEAPDMHSPYYYYSVESRERHLMICRGHRVHQRGEDLSC